ncbi:hypothetical protein ACFXKJ_04080 [Kitasatospora indigofera]|uniref:hypothetical protein n=1 Tax=Kitasatospora indigofera TaxID=67307 RepID=UPI0036CD60EC
MCRPLAVGVGRARRAGGGRAARAAFAHATGGAFLWIAPALALGTVLALLPEQAQEGAGPTTENRPATNADNRSPVT